MSSASFSRALALSAALAAALAAAGGPVAAVSDVPATLSGIVLTLRPDALAVPHVYEGGWTHYVGGGVAVLDCDDDARPDLFMAGGASPSRLWRNVTSGPGAPLRFGAAPTPAAEAVTGAYPIDIDGDDRLDLIVLRDGPDALWQGLGDCRFAPAPAAWGFAPGAHWSTAFAATWEPRAAWPTLALGHYVDRTNPAGPFEACDANALHRPAGPGARAFGPPVPLAPGFCALSMLISDWQRTGIPDLRISNDRHYYVRGGREQMWRLDPLREYTEADGWPTLQLWGMGIASRDLTGDGLPEVFLTSMGDQVLQYNRGGGVMEAAPHAQGTYATTPYSGDDGRPSTGWHAEFGDVDNDGRDDLFIAKGNVEQMPSNAMADPNNLLIQRPDGTFAEAGGTSGVGTPHRARGAALADLDGDGRLDLVVVNRRAPAEIFQNASADTGAWIALDLRARGPNTRAVGAIVELRTPDGRIQTREVTVGGGHAGGQAGPLHFGLGDASTAEVRVHWPGGPTSDWTALPANAHHRLTP